MANWIRLLTFTEAGVKTVRRNPAELLNQLAAMITEAGGTLVQAFATLGAFDLLSIIDARDEQHMEEIDQKLSNHGLYTAVNVPAVAIGEFIQLAQSSPVFLKAWLDGRDSRQRSLKANATLAAARAVAEPVVAAPRAASPKVVRKEGVNTRQGRRSSAATGMTLALGALGAVEVASVSLGPGDTQAAFLVRIPAAEARAAGLVDLERNARLAGQIELVAEKSRVSVSTLLVRVDPTPDGSAYDVLVESKDVPRSLGIRLERLVRAPAR